MGQSILGSKICVSLRVFEMKKVWDGDDSTGLDVLSIDEKLWWSKGEWNLSSVMLYLVFRRPDW